MHEEEMTQVDVADLAGREVDRQRVDLGEVEVHGARTLGRRRRLLWKRVC